MHLIETNRVRPNLKGLNAAPQTLKFINNGEPLMAYNEKALQSFLSFRRTLRNRKGLRIGEERSKETFLGGVLQPLSIRTDRAEHLSPTPPSRTLPLTP